MKNENIEHIISEIDEALDRPPISVEEALQEAVKAGRMTLEESSECLECYLRAFKQDYHQP